MIHNNIQKYFPFSEDYFDVYFTTAGLISFIIAMIIGGAVLFVLMIPWLFYQGLKSLWSYTFGCGFSKNTKNYR
jgi:hypothetical protein